MNPTLDRNSFVLQFWSDVKKLLEEKIAERQFEDAVFNRGEEQAAEVVDGLIRYGVPTLAS